MNMDATSERKTAISAQRSAVQFGGRMKWFLVLVALLSLVGPPTALAQFFPFGRWGRDNLTKEDWDQLYAARDKALADPAAVGTKESWANPQSGDSGTIEIRKAFERNDLTCRNVRYVITRKGQTTNRIYVMNECKDTDGKWKFV